MSVLPPALNRRLVWKYAAGLAPGVLVWLVLVGWLATLLYSRANWSEEADEAVVREWLDEARNFRKTLPELVADYVRMKEESTTPERLREKRAEIAEQMRALAEPTRAYLGQLPGFPVVYRLEVAVRAGPSSPPEVLAWDSPLPRPRQPTQNRVRAVEYPALGDADGRATVRCEYQMHAFNKLQRREADRRRVSWVAGAVLLAATLLAGLFVARFLARERSREVERLTALARVEHQEKVVLEARLLRREAEADAADAQKRAAEAEKSALEMKSQLYASIGIMAGSYAHNIKNLLVRPNDLLARCIEADGLSRDQTGMLHEVKSTLGTVTERLQQILRTVRRDPGNAEVTRVDLAQLVKDTAATWSEMGKDKWKLNVVAEPTDGPLWVSADLSHLQQAVENLVFNARDATFEMRSHLREAARQVSDPTARKARLIEAAGWTGKITLAARRMGSTPVLEVRDNGIGMTEEVRANCLRTHFTTKRDNALYEGYSAGMGLGLSFVAVVLEHHQAELEIESEPLRGTTFRVRFSGGSENPR